MKNLLFSILGILCSSFVEANDSVYATVGGFDEDGGNRSGAQLAGTYFSDSGYGLQGGGMIYDSNPETDFTGIFSGYFFTGFLHVPLPLGPYVGLGAFMGQDKECTRDRRGNTVCNENYITAFYPEVGLSISVANVRITPFMRRFFDDVNNFHPFNVYGINLSFKIDEK